MALEKEKLYIKNEVVFIFGVLVLARHMLAYRFCIWYDKNNKLDLEEYTLKKIYHMHHMI